MLKTDMDIFPMRVRRDQQSGRAVHILHITHNKDSANGGMISSGLMRKYSLEKMILELEKLHVVEGSSGNITELERTRKQKDILGALEKVSWW